MGLKPGESWKQGASCGWKISRNVGAVSSASRAFSCSANFFLGWSRPRLGSACVSILGEGNYEESWQCPAGGGAARGKELQGEAGLFRWFGF